MGEDQHPIEKESSTSARWWEAVIAMLVAVALFQSLRAVTAGRLQRLTCQDHPNFNTFFHVAWNFQDSGVFRQTTHSGYVDSWLWGGHLTLTFPVVSALLRLHPTPGFLNAIQLAAVCSAVVAGLLLGRSEARHPAGGLLGMVAVACSPPLLVLALADYQDLVLCIPAVLWATVFIRRGWLWPSLIACAAVAACREECLALVPLLGATVRGSTKRRIVWAAACTTAGLAVLLPEIWLSRSIESYPNPFLVVGPGSLRSLGGMLQLPFWMQQNLQTYYLLFEPLGPLALLSPLHLIGVAGVLAVHCGDFFHAKDWQSPLVHHFAPAVAMITAAVVIGGGRVLRLVKARGRVGAVLVWILVGTCLIGSAWRVAGWHVFRGTVWHSPITGLPTDKIKPHPAWELARTLPAEASVVTDTRMVLAIADRPWAYDFHDSLEEKSKGLGLRCVHYALLSEDDGAFMEAIRNVPGHRIVQRLDGYVLIRLQPMDQPLPAECKETGR